MDEFIKIFLEIHKIDLVKIFSNSELKFIILMIKKYKINIFEQIREKDIKLFKRLCFTYLKKSNVKDLYEFYQYLLKNGFFNKLEKLIN